MSLKQQVVDELVSTPTASIVVLLLFWALWRYLHKRRAVAESKGLSADVALQTEHPPGLFTRLTQLNKTNPLLFVMVTAALLYCAVSISGSYELPAFFVAAIYTLPFIYLLIQAERPNDSHGLFFFAPVITLIALIKEKFRRFRQHPKTKLVTGYIYVLAIFGMLLYYLMVAYNVIGYGFGAGPTLFFVHLSLLLALDGVLQFVNRQKTKGYFPANMIYLAVPLFMGLVLLDPNRSWYPSTFAVARSLFVLQLSLFFIYIVVVYLLIKHGQKVFPRHNKWFKASLSLIVIELVLVPVAMTTTTIMRLDLSSCEVIDYNSKTRLLPIHLASDIAIDDQFLYVSQKEKKLITRFSINGDEIEQLKINAEPQMLSLDKQSKLLFVLHVDDHENQLSVIDTNNFTESTKVLLPGCSEAFSMTESEQHRRLLVLCSSNNDNLFIVDSSNASVVGSTKNPAADNHAFYAALDSEAENIWTINLFGGHAAKLSWQHQAPEQIEHQTTFQVESKSVIQGIEVLQQHNQVVISKNFQLHNFPFGGLQAFNADSFETEWNLSIYSARYIDYDPTLDLLYVASMADGMLSVIDPGKGSVLRNSPVGEQVRGIRVLDDHSVLICSKCGVVMYTPPRCLGGPDKCQDIKPRLTRRFAIGFDELPGE
jgi:hypothetical protein